MLTISSNLHPRPRQLYLSDKVLYYPYLWRTFASAGGCRGTSQITKPVAEWGGNLFLSEPYHSAIHQSNKRMYIMYALLRRSLCKPSWTGVPPFRAHAAKRQP